MRTFERSETNGKTVADPVRIYLDSNVFIDALEAQPTDADPAIELLTELARHPRRAVTSELTLAEVLVRPERERLKRLKRDYLELLVFSKIIDLRPVSRSILLESVRYRAAAHPDKPDPAADRRNFLPDAIHVVTAVDAGARFFVARDNRIRVPIGMVRLAADAAGIQTIIGSLAP
jgi:predicted nucleic acid-binding protein